MIFFSDFKDNTLTFFLWKFELTSQFLLIFFVNNVLDVIFICVLSKLKSLKFCNFGFLCLLCQSATAPP